jgi:hypothetical protein
MSPMDGRTTSNNVSRRKHNYRSVYRHGLSEAFHSEPTQIDNFQVNWREHRLVRGGSVHCGHPLNQSILTPGVQLQYIEWLQQKHSDVSHTISITFLTHGFLTHSLEHLLCIYCNGDWMEWMIEMRMKTRMMGGMKIEYYYMSCHNNHVIVLYHHAMLLLLRLV